MKSAQEIVENDGVSALPLPAGWWAPGLNLAERLAVRGDLAPPQVPGATGEAEPDRHRRARRRLERWKERLSANDDSQPFDWMLADAGLDEAGLLALLAEDPAVLTERVGAPEWARYTESALADMPDDAEFAESGEELSGEHAVQRGATLIMEPFLAEARRRMDASTIMGQWREMSTGHAAAGPIGEFARRLRAASMRTLVLELNVLRITNGLVGDTPRARFWSFVRHFRRREHLAALVAEYPVLARLAATSMIYGTEAWIEMAQRFVADRPAIVSKLLGGEDPGRVTEVQVAGDVHAQGRAVCILSFEGGAKLVYKPRPVSGQRHFNELVGQLATDLGSWTPGTVPLLDCGDYGWAGFVAYRPCADQEQARLYYRRLGVLIAVLHALDATDAHFENLIADGDQPVAVDLETLLHPENVLLEPEATEDPALRAYRSSVQRTGVLPRPIFGSDESATDLSGMGGDAEAPTPYPVLTWAEPATDEMRTLRAPGRMVGASNQPKLSGSELDPGGFVGEVREGLRTGYQAVLRLRARATSADDLLAPFQQDVLRLVLRATQTYGVLTSEATHPDVMRDALDRDAVLGHLWTLSRTEPARELIPSEIEAIWAGDIPMFVMRGGDRHVRDAAGRPVLRLPDRPCDAVAEKIRRMAEADLARQDWIVLASMATRDISAGADPRAGEPVHRQADVRGPTWDAERVLDTAKRVGDLVLSHAHVADNAVGWLGLHPVGNTRWQVAPLDFSIYSGYPAVGLFFAHLARISGEAKYEDAAATVYRRALGDASRLADFDEFEQCGGAFVGPASLAYCLVHTGTLLGTPPDDAVLSALLQPLVAAARADEVLDVLAGSAGCLAVADALSSSLPTGSPAAATAQRLAQAAAERLAATAQPHAGGVAWNSNVESSAPLTGFSHGAAGIGWALVRHAAQAGRPEYAELGHRAFAYERETYQPDLRDWPDYRTFEGKREPQGPEDVLRAWCHGSPGIGLARAGALAYGGGAILGEDLDLAITSFLSVGPSGSDCLCHGELGNLELLTAAVTRGRTDLRGPLERRAMHVVERIETSGPICGTPRGIPTATLMCGLAGIGYGLLRLIAPDRVPSVLLLDPATMP